MKKSFIYLAALCMLFVQQFGMAEETPSFSTNQKDQIEKIVHDYLVNNPKVLIEASRSLQSMQRKEMMEQAERAIKDNRIELLKDNMSFAGNAKGDVVLIEFFDYKCMHCKRMAPVLKDIVKSDKNLKVIYKQLPIFGGVSTYAAKAALASAKQHKYKQFHDALLNANKSIEKADILKLAKKVGLNVAKLKKDIADPKLEAVIQANMQLAQKIGIMGTPAFIVATSTDDQAKFSAFYMPGAAHKPTLKAMIDKARHQSHEQQPEKKEEVKS